MLEHSKENGNAAPGTSLDLPFARLLYMHQTHTAGLIGHIPTYVQRLQQPWNNHRITRSCDQPIETTLKVPLKMACLKLIDTKQCFRDKFWPKGIHLYITTDCPHGCKLLLLLPGQQLT